MLDINRQLSSEFQFDSSLTIGKQAHWQMNAKRLTKIVVALFGQLRFGPSFVVALLSSAPVFFRQLRYSINRTPFRILKFRTVTTLENRTEVAQARMADERVTRVGYWLHRLNVDELPQLLKVLFGEMLFVGLRPHAPMHDCQIRRKIAFYALRHNMKPSITGWAQVNGLRGSVLTDDHIRNRVEHDLFYIRNRSLLSDLRILWLTFASPKGRRNAF